MAVEERFTSQNLPEWHQMKKDLSEYADRDKSFAQIHFFKKFSSDLEL